MVVLDPLVGALYERWCWGLFHQPSSGPSSGPTTRSMTRKIQEVWVSATDGRETFLYMFKNGLNLV